MENYGTNALTEAYEKGHRHLFETLIEDGVDFDCQRGFQLLMEKCEQKNMDDFEFLLKHGVNTIGKI